MNTCIFIKFNIESVIDKETGATIDLGHYNHIISISDAGIFEVLKFNTPVKFLITLSAEMSGTTSGPSP